MKTKVSFYSTGIYISMDAETVEEAASLVSFGLNSKTKCPLKVYVTSEGVKGAIGIDKRRTSYGEPLQFSAVNPS